MVHSRQRNALEFCCIFFFLFCFSFLLNFFWEAMHAVYLYQKHDFDSARYVPMLLYVSSMDSLIVCGIYLGISLMWWNLFWIKNGIKKQLFVFTLIGMSFAAIIEYLFVYYFHRWAYKVSMPTIFGIGVSPLVQLSITGLLSVYLTRELLYGKGLFMR